MNDWNPEDIKAAVRKRGVSMAALAEANGVSPQILSLALRATISERAENIIADFIGMPPGKIWPTRYDRDGNRIRLRTRKRESA